MITRVSLGTCMLLEPVQVRTLKVVYELQWLSNQHHVYAYYENQLTEPFQEHDLIE